MAKQPYIPFYIGDYLKDTRILPLNVRGGWVDLILYMWDNPIKGELIGTHDDFDRLMACTKEECNLVIQTLNQKNIFAYADLPDGRMKIESRKIKKMVSISKTRKIAGMQGGNPNLLNQKDNQKDNQNPEDEDENENKINPLDIKEFEELKKYFGFNEIANPNKTRKISEFLSLLNYNKRLEYFKNQFHFYKTYKATAKEKVHSFDSFISGGWEAENWEKKYNDFKKNNSSSIESLKANYKPITFSNEHPK